MRARNYDSFASLVKGLRRARGLSQRAVAETLGISVGYVGQWEVGAAQPSSEVAAKLCQAFDIEDVEYVQRLAYAERAPDWLKESVLNYRKETALSDGEHRVVTQMRRLSPTQADRLVARVEGWVEAALEE